MPNDGLIDETGALAVGPFFHIETEIFNFVYLQRLMLVPLPT